MPPRVALRPARRRSTSTNAVSKSGATSNITMTTDVHGNVVVSFSTGTSDAPAMAAPMNRLPQSPMKSRAGGRFQ